MKTTSCLVTFCSLFLVGACATKQPYSTAAEINEECIIEMEAARTAIQLRDKGKTRDYMASTLPPLDKNSSRLLVQLHQIVDESFHYSELNEVIYPTYRFEMCVRQLTGKTYPRSIQNVHSKLMACQQQYGKQASTAATQCVTGAIDQNNLPASN